MFVFKYYIFEIKILKQSTTDAHLDNFLRAGVKNKKKP